MRNPKSIQSILAILAALTLLSGQTRAAIAVIDSKNLTYIAANGSISSSFTVSSGASAMVVILGDRTSAPPGSPATLTWNGQTLTRLVTTYADTTSYREVAIYYLFNPTAGGPFNITGSVTNGNDVWLAAYTLSGVDTTLTPLTGSTNNTAGTSLSFTVGSVPDGAWAAVDGMFGHAATAANFTIVGTGGTTTTTTVSNNQASSTMGYVSGLSAGTDTFTFNTISQTANKIAFAVAVFTPGGTGLPFVSPARANLECGSTVTFTANPVGTNAPFSFQWYDNQTNLMAGQTNVTLTLSNLYMGQAGNYTVAIHDNLGSNSAAMATLTVADTTPPVITLNGPNPMTVDRYSTFTDPGATAVDGCAGPVGVTATGSVSTSTCGVYTVTYTANDGNGNSATAIRTVNVAAHPYISGCNSTGTNCVIYGTNGIEGGIYYVLSSTNMTLPLSQWSPETTNQFDGSGNFSFTIKPDNSVNAKFFIVAGLNSSGFTPQNLLVLPQSETETSMALLWDKPDNHDNVAAYEVYQNGALAATTSPGQTFYCATNLTPNTSYSFFVVARDTNSNRSAPTPAVSASTRATGVVLDVSAPPYNAKGDGIAANTTAIQQAINDCPPGGTVKIPAGTFMTGPLVLKSNMSFYVASGGVLQGTTYASDYSPKIWSRSMGVECNVFQPLIRVGTMDHTTGYTCGNVTLYGEGEIIGGGNALDSSENDYDHMSRLVLIQNCQNVSVMGLHLKNPVQWTIHPIYSDNITVLNVWVESWEQNESGDGFDPDSSTDCYCVNTLLHTYDNSFSPKSGRILEGYTIAKPTRHVRAVGCTFQGGSPCLGSECSGGLEDIVIRDSTFYGTTIQFRTSASRGAYMRNFTMEDDVFTSGSSSQSIYFWTSCPYRTNAPWAPLPCTIITNFLFKNITGVGGINMDGSFAMSGGPARISYIQNCVFTNITMANGRSIAMQYCDGIQFNNVRHTDGTLPTITLTGTNYNIFRDNVVLTP
jgi:polygalacturonase